MKTATDDWKYCLYNNGGQSGFSGYTAGEMVPSVVFIDVKEVEVDTDVETPELTEEQKKAAEEAMKLAEEAAAKLAKEI